jgi:lysophospholipase L1-like esterase
MLSQPDSSSLPHVPRVSSALRRALVTAIGTPLIGACSNNPAQPTVLYVAPKVTCPAPAPLLSPTGQPAIVTFASPAAAGGTPPTTVSCTPASGSMFPIGTTTVTCLATDQVKRTASCVFSVTVTAPPSLSLTRILAFGDSITAGEIITEGDALKFRALLIDPQLSYPADLQADLASYYTAQSQSITVTNSGRKDEKTAAGAARLSTALAQGAYQVLLLMEGANDLPDIADALMNMRAMVRTAKNQGLQVFIATLPPENKNANGSCVPGAFDRGINADSVPPYNDGLRALAGNENVPIVDVYGAFGGVAADDLIDCDGLHPTARGYQLIADTFAAAIEGRLTSPRSSGAVGLKTKPATRAF